jgi:uncharacterized protein (DUF2252 family)
MDIVDATRWYERWMARQISIVKPDLAHKHQQMAESAFIFLRGTFYRWAQLWPTVCASLADAPSIPSVGDVHVENFGTWRDLEGRLIWGVNDVDEACLFSYTNDLVRLATSATLATRQNGFKVSARDLCDAILDGYTTSLEQKGSPFVLAERRGWLKRTALNELRDPAEYWSKFDALKPATGHIPHDVLRAALPDARVRYRALKRVAGVGSLGRRRIVALGEWCGARVAREAKARLPSAAVWATGRASVGVDAASLLERAVRAPDPFLKLHDKWIVRRLAPDCSRIELTDLPQVRDEERLLRAMGWEIANVHLGARRAGIRTDLKARPARWLRDAAVRMADVVEKEWRQWVKRA